MELAPEVVDVLGHMIPDTLVGICSTQIKNWVELVGAPRRAGVVFVATGGVAVDVVSGPPLSVRSLTSKPSLFASRSTNARANPSVIRMVKPCATPAGLPRVGKQSSSVSEMMATFM